MNRHSSSKQKKKGEMKPEVKSKLNDRFINSRGLQKLYGTQAVNNLTMVVSQNMLGQKGINDELTNSTGRISLKHDDEPRRSKTKSKRMDESTGGTKMIVSKLMLPVKQNQLYF